MTEVNVLETIVLPADEEGRWLERWREDYLPAARSRGLRHERTWRSHEGPDTIALHILWWLSSPYDFYAMRTAAGRDPSVAEFWAATDTVARTRERRVMAVER
ncbi:hypothetical protein [Actinomadura sp. 9N407]|uniref:hypothetical protein n=1 Tax=Actinomadura sp. 9N407 TaxID=3375154 RepID=UPI0037BD2A91